MIATIVSDVWHSRELVAQLVQRDLRLRYRQAIMGFAWALFLPVLTISAGLVVRMMVASHAAQGTAPSLGGIAIKSWAWAFFAGAMNFATMSLLSNVQLVTKIYFPREVLPISSIVAQCVDSAIGLAVILLAGHWLGFQWSLQLVWVPVLLILMLMFTSGLALLFASANLFFRDVKYILQVLLTFGIFFTPVLFEPASFKRPMIRELMMLNPLSPVLEGLRLTLVDGASLLHVLRTAEGALIWSPWYLVYAVALAVVVPLLALGLFRRSAGYFAEYY